MRDITEYNPDDEEHRLLAGPPPTAAPPQQEQQQAPVNWTRANAMLSGQNPPAPQGMQSRFSVPDRGPTKAFDMEKAPEHNQGRGIWMAALDLILNKGRNIGSIMSSDADSYRREVDDWRKTNNPEAILKRQTLEQQLKRGDQEMLNANNEQFARMKGLQFHQRQIEDAEKNADREYTRQTGRDAVADQHWETSEDRANRTLAEQQAHDRAVEAQARAQTGLGYSQIKAANQRNDADNVAAIERARIMANARANDPAARLKQQQAEALLTPFEGTEVADDATWRGKVLTPAIKDKLATSDAKIAGAIPALQRMKELRAKYGAEAGIGRQSSAIRAQYDFERGKVQSALGALRDMGTLQEADLKRLDAMTPEMDYGLSDLNPFSDSRLGALEGGATEFQRLLGDTRKQYGLRARTATQARGSGGVGSSAASAPPSPQDSDDSDLGWGFE